MLHIPSFDYKKLILSLVAVIAIGFGWWTISPFFYDTTVSEPLADGVASPEQMITYQAGSFMGVEGHSAQGTASIINRGNDVVVRFDDDFEVTNGPDLYVYFGKDGEYDAQARLAPLKGNVGSQNYIIPNEIDYGKYNEVWIWCRAFRTPFAVAELQ